MTPCQAEPGPKGTWSKEHLAFSTTAQRCFHHPTPRRHSPHLIHCAELSAKPCVHSGAAFPALCFHSSPRARSVKTQRMTTTTVITHTTWHASEPRCKPSPSRRLALVSGALNNGAQAWASDPDFIFVGRRQISQFFGSVVPTHIPGVEPFWA